MSLKLQAVKNVSATWLGLLVNGVVGFLLSPFVLHRLGDEAFSLWILMFALTGYYGLLDLGIRSSIVKYTAKFIANNDEDQLRRVLSTSLGFYLLVAIAVLLATVIGVVYLPLLLKIPARLIAPARMLFLLAGVGTALTFPLSVFAAVLEGLQKFAWLQLSHIGITLIRAALTVVALTSGRGLLTIGTITVSTNLLAYLVFTWMALRVLPVRLSTRQIEWSSFRKMLSYGIFAFVILVAEKLRFQSDAMVIGVFLSTTAVTSFVVALKLVEYSSYVVRSMSQIITPMSSQFEASGDLVRLQRTFVAGNRACAFIIFPLCVTLIILGKSIIECWVGVKYIASYPILLLLIVPRSMFLAQSASSRILLGMGKHRVLGWVLLVEGGANLVLSLLLVRRFGLIGVALGTAIPMICTSLFFLPQHLCALLKVPLGAFLSRAYRLPLILCAPLGFALWLLNYEFPAHQYGKLLLQIACGGLAYGAGIAALLYRGRVERLTFGQAFTQLLEPKIEPE